MNISKKKAINALKEIYKIANHASLSGAFGSGEEPLMSTYNKIKELSIKNKWVEEDLVIELPIGKGDEMDNVGTAAKLLAAMLEVEEDFEYTEAKKKYDENGYEMKDNAEE